MSQKICHAELREKTQQLLQGALKHVRTAALAAVLVPLGAVTVSPSVALAQASGGVPSPCDFVTSGGFVVTDMSARANFGAHGGCKNGAFTGNVNYVDHGIGLHVAGFVITGYLFSGSNTRDICGMATTNTSANPVKFRVRLIDNGEPGTTDAFGIRFIDSSGTVYLVTTRTLGGGRPGGGNIDLHAPNPSTVGPDPAPNEATMCNGVDAP